MKIFRFDSEVGILIDHHGSSGFVISKVAHSFDEVVIDCAYLRPNGLLGYHQATLSQLFLLV